MKKRKKVVENSLQSLFDFPGGDLVLKDVLLSKDRIKRAYAELFSGYAQSADNTLNETVRVREYSGLVIMRDIQFYSFCKHHFLPFFGSADIAYQPDQIITGLGKLVRLVRHVHARRLQIQEIMSKDIAEDLMKVLGAKGAVVRTKAKHLCMCSRGPGDDVAWTEVVYRTGTLSKENVADLFPAESR